MTEQSTGVVLNMSTPRLVFDGAMDNVAVPIEEPSALDPLEEPELTTTNVFEPDEVMPMSDIETDGPEIGEPVDATSDSSSDNLDEMSVEELQRQQEEIDRKIKQKRETEKKAVIDQIVHVVETYKIPLDELLDALGGMKIKRKGVKAKPKYQDPKTGAIWSGRGKEPSWIKGKKRDPFLIK
jgi:DNA-binding protein H-NS